MKTIELTIDNKPVVVDEGTSVFDAARMNGIPPWTEEAHLQKPREKPKPQRSA